MAKSGYNIDFISAEQLLEYPRPQPLIEGFIQEQEAVCLYGEPNGGKSFLALSWALCVATGTPWLGQYAVTQGPVIYMAGEGAPSLQRRVRAWQKHHNRTDVHGAYFQVRALPLREEDVIDEILATLDDFVAPYYGAGEARMSTRLIVVDTLSQFFGGGDENGPDMALFVNNVRRLSQDHNTAVLIVHHTNKGGQAERGHTALRGNVDAMFKCQPVYEDNVLVGLHLLNDKQRDSPRSQPTILKLTKVVFGSHDDDNSLVVVPTMIPPSHLPKVTRTLLRVLGTMLNVEDQEKERCHNRVVATRLGNSVSTVHEHLERLHRLKLVKHGERGYSGLTTLGRLVLDDAGIKREEKE